MVARVSGEGFADVVTIGCSEGAGFRNL